MTQLNKTDIAAIRGAHDICIHLNPAYPAGLVRLIRRRDINVPFSEDIEWTLPAIVRLRGQQDGGTVTCFAMRGIYHSQRSHVSTILKTLRAGDELTFTFWPDAHSNGYVARAGLHADLLQLDVYRAGKHIACWEFETSITADNSARMCRGVPVSESYHDAAKRAGG